MTTKYAFYLVVDNRLEVAASTVAASLAQRWGQDVHIFVEGTIDPAGIRLRHPGIYYHENALARYLPEGLPESVKWPKIVYMRLFAPQLLNDYERLIYLDADILPLEVDERIWTLPLGNAIGAVQDFEVTNLAPVAVGGRKRDWLDSIGVRSERYFNSGVLVFDTAYWATLDINTSLSDFVKKYSSSVRMFDQDFLNYLFQDNWRELSPAWNYQASLFLLGVDYLCPPVFLHFSKIEKPWMGQFVPEIDDIDKMGHISFVNAARSLGLDPSGLLEPKKINPLSRAKYRLRRKLSELGIQTGKEKRLRRALQRKYIDAFDYLRIGASEARFCDGLSGSSIDLPLPHVVFDGKALRSPVSGRLKRLLTDHDAEGRS